MKRFLAAAAVFCFLAAAVTGCGGGQGGQQTGAEQPQDSGKKVLLNGAGASFPYPLYSRWIDAYGKMEKNVQINYQSAGSGAGIKQFSEQVIDFGGTDATMSDEQLAKAPGEVFHIPTVMGAVAVIYNLPGVTGKLRLSPDTLADIYLGKIKKWNDPRLAALNSQLKLPDLPILVVRRSDGSGTTNIFTDYLCAVNPEWKAKVGQGTSVNWPVGTGGKGNEGVSQRVSATSGAIGYVELAYALLNNLTYAELQNSAGAYVAPSIEGTMAAAAGAAQQMPADLRVSIVNAPGEKAYPIAGYTYILVYKEQADPDKGTALAKFLWWVIHEGDQMAKELHYAPLPEEVKKKVEEKLKSITHQGKSLL